MHMKKKYLLKFVNKLEHAKKFLAPTKILSIQNNVVKSNFDMTSSPFLTNNLNVTFYRV